MQYKTAIEILNKKVSDILQKYGSLKTENEMLRTPNFGRKSLNEIKEVLTGMSLYLGMEIPNWPPDNIVEKTKNYVTNLFNNAKDQAVDDFEKDVVRETDFTHLEISVGQDIFDLGGSSTSTKTKTEAVGVYRLHENDNTFIFNQTSLVNYNDRRTINLGLGAREINDDETAIYGGNIFYD